MQKKVAIVQSNYIPWKGYFDLINSVDEFILYDDVQYTKQDWRNRNQIKTRDGLMWLTIPIQTCQGSFQNIKDVEISDRNWSQRHWKSITHNYVKARYFYDFKEEFEDLYLNCKEINLSKINYYFLVPICRILGIKTKLNWSMNYKLEGDKTERLISLCQQSDATHYISGPKAKNYMNESLFKESGITLSYIDYLAYPEYNQLFPPFEHGVSILDLIFNEGQHSTQYMKSFECSI